MSEDRVTRLAQRLRREAAHYEDHCFQQFIWVPLPDNKWELVTGTRSEHHAHLYRTRGRPIMAEAWGIPEGSTPWAMEPYFIPSGYVDYGYDQSRSRDTLMLQVPKQFPPGWSLWKLKQELFCTEELEHARVLEDPQRGIDPAIAGPYLKMLERIRDEEKLRQQAFP